jgi:LAS superfamily LD-carboxypeptidase LdcB
VPVARAHGQDAAATRPRTRPATRPATSPTTRALRALNQPLRRPPLLPTAALLVVLTLVTGGVGHAQAESARSESLHQQRLTAVAAEESARTQRALRARSDAATSARLMAGAATYAAAKRTEALSLAQAAVISGGAVVSTAAPVVSAADLAPLDQAVAQLTALIQVAPAPGEVLTDALVAQQQDLTEQRQAVPPALAARVAEDPPVTATPTADASAVSASDERADAGSEAEPLVTGQASDVTETSADASASPAGDPATDGVALAAPAAATPDAAGAAAPATAWVLPNQPLPAGPLAEGLDLGVSAQILITAQQINALSAQVQVVAEANIAAAEAKRQAAETAAAKARAVRAGTRAKAAEIARKVAIADASPNGAIPLDALCGVSFVKGVLLRCDAVRPLEDLNKAFRAHFGRNLAIDSSYRDLATQVLTKQARGGLASVPGKSNHGRGLAVDLGGFGTVGQFDLPTYLWMKTNAPLYGWNHPPYMEPGGAGPYEPWHWEYDTL